MDKSPKFFWIFAVVVLLAGLFLLFRAESPEDGAGAALLPEGSIILGAVLPLTGDGALYGLPIQRAATLAMNEINLAGGIAGQQIEIIWEDGKCEARAATSAAQKLITVDGVNIILGGVCASETLAMAPITEGAMVLVISPSATSPDISDVGDFVFRTAPSDALAGRVAAEYAVNTLGAKRLAVLAETKDYTQGLRRVFKEVAQELGVEIVADEVFSSNDSNFRAQLTKVKAATPDVVYLLPQTPAPGGLILKQMRDLGLDAQLLSAEVMIGRDVVKEHKVNMEGLIGVEHFFDENSERTQKFLRAYQETYSEEPPFPAFMANMYSQVYLIADAIKEVGVESTAIRDYFYGLNKWEGALGSVTFDERGDVLSQYLVKQVTDGVLVDIEVYSLGQQAVPQEQVKETVEAPVM
jgi:branched-chain amino acid transport system substrate-binding protein